MNHFLLLVAVSAFTSLLTPISTAIAQTQNLLNPNPLNPPASNSSLTYLKDIQKHWAKDFILGLSNRNLINQSQNFEPDQKVTRAEFAVILDRSFPFQPTVRQAIAFNDVPSNFWAATAIQNGYMKGFWSGTDTNNFRPQELISRSQAMVAIANVLNLPTNPKLDPNIFLVSMYTDATLIPQTAIAAIAALTDRQIIVNYPDVRKLNPINAITRAELSALIYQALVQTGQSPKIASNFIPSPTSRLFNPTDFAGKEIITHLKVNLRRREVVSFQGTKKLKTYPLGIGRAGWETPSGTYRVRQIILNPDWKNPFTGDVIKSNDPDNPLGGFWIGFWTNGKDWSGFHGTSNRDSVGKASSHGCLRMYKEDIKAIFAKVTPATVVEVTR